MQKGFYIKISEWKHRYANIISKMHLKNMCFDIRYFLAILLLFFYLKNVIVIIYLM